MEKLTILFSGSLPDLIRKELHARLPQDFELEFLNDKPTSERAESVRKADFLMGSPRGCPEGFEEASKLKLVQLLSAGYDMFDVSKATQLGIPVANNGGANSIAVAEHTILLILALYKKLSKHYDGLKKGEWVREKDHPLNMYELANKKIGIIGMGNIGKALVKRLKGFETELYYYDVIRFEETEKEFGLEYKPLEEILKICDIVSLHVPLLKTTENMIGERELGMMKNTALLINTARGGLIDEDALYKALKDKEIAGVGLDAFVGERKVRTEKYKSPLFELENVVATPHYAGHTYDTWFRRIENCYGNIVRTAKGEKPNYVVNKEVLA